MELNAYNLLSNLEALIVQGFDPDSCADGNIFLFLHFLLHPEVLYIVNKHKNCLLIKRQFKY